MNEPRRVLAVDEQRATLDFLNSVLPLMEGESFEIQRVLSAEEALLELRRKPYDLLITGFQLPGMDGLTLSRRAKRLRPEIGIILASSRPPSELRDQAVARGVDRVLRKPLDAEEFLAAVQEALATVPLAAAQGKQASVVEEPLALPSAVIRRLETLREETGAEQVLLATVTGEILHVTGGKLHRQIPRLAAAASASVSRALDLSRLLNEREPKVVQFVEGLDTDLYWANVGRSHFIAILFDAQVRRGRIGTVWVFAQRAVTELNGLIGESQPGPPAPERDVDPAGTSAKPDSGPEAKPTAAATARRPRAEVAEPSTEDDRGLDDDAQTPGQEASPDDGDNSSQGRLPEDLELEAFWDEALAVESGDEALSEGISFEEAKARGLVPGDFDPDDESGEA